MYTFNRLELIGPSDNYIKPKYHNFNIILYKFTIYYSSRYNLNDLRAVGRNGILEDRESFV